MLVLVSQDQRESQVSQHHPDQEGESEIMATRTEKIQQYKKGKVFHPDHMHTDYFEYWLRDFVSDGSCLNICCGYSEVGDVRVDISADSARTMEGDLFKLLETFRENQFDYVYIDPPFEFYVTGKEGQRFNNLRHNLLTTNTIGQRPVML
jgi:hypothetical protein